MANLSNINGKFVVDTAGNIGVGTLNPRSDANTTNISIQSSGTARLFVNNTGASGKEYAIYSSANGDFGIFDYDAVSARLVINSAGNATFAGSITANTSSIPTLIVGRDGTDGDVIQVYNGATGTTKALAISANGNDGTIYSQYGNIILQPTAGSVGIGTTGPGEKLEVNGNILATVANNGTIKAKYNDNNTAHIQANSSGGVISASSSGVNTVLLRSYGDSFFTGGQVGIGNTDPKWALNTNLSIEGTSLAYLDGTSNNQTTTNNIGVSHSASGFGGSNGAQGGLFLANNNNASNAPSPIIFFGARSASNTYNHAYAAIYGIKTGGGADSNWNVGELTFATGDGTGPRRRMTIDKDGNVGVGVDSPDAKLHVNAGTSNTVALFESTDATAKIFVKDNSTSNDYSVGIGAEGDNLTFHAASGGTERMRITSAGIIEGRADISSYTNSQTVFAGYGDTDSGEYGIALSTAGDGLAGSIASNLKYSNGTITQLNTARSSGEIKFSNTTIASQTADISFGGYYKGTTTFVERMRIDSSGFTTIKTGSPGASLTLSQAGSLALNENIGYLNFYSNDASTSSSGGVGGIGVYAETAFNTSYTPTYMSFFTHAETANDGTVLGNVIERMRINSVGDVLLRTEGNPNGTSVYGSAFTTETSNRMILRMASSTTGTVNLVQFYNGNGLVGKIQTSGSATSYITSSDYRLKEDLKDFAGLDMVSKIPVYDFKWKTDESRSYGVMAHELKEVLPDAVSGEKDAEEMQGVDYSKIVPLLVKSIQELKAEIELLKNK